MTMLLRTLLLLALALPVAAVTAPVAPLVAEAQAADHTVAIQMLVVHATDSVTGVDPRLKSLESSFKYFKYKGYKLLSTQNAQLSAGKDTSFTLEGGRRVKVTVLAVDDARAKVRVEISNKESKLLDTTVSINRDGTFIVAGPRYEDGILMLPLRASY